MKKRIVYTSKYDNETSQFIKKIAGNLMLKDLAEQLDVTYATLHNAFKNNRITYELFGKIVGKIPMDSNDIVILKTLVK